MPQIRPITDLRNTNDVSDEKMLETIIDNAISDAESEYEQDGQIHDARTALASLRRKYFS